MATSGVFVCTICSSFASRSYGPVLRHIGVVHRFGPSCSIRCGIDGCPAAYNSEKYESFRSHVYRKHRSVLCATQDDDEMETDDNDDNPMNSHQSVVENTSVDDLTAATKKAAAVFLLKTLEERRVTQKALAGIVADTDSLWGVLLDHLQQALKDKLGTDIELRDVLDQQLLHPFEGLQSDYMREKYFRETFSLIVSYTVHNNPCLPLPSPPKITIFHSRNRSREYLIATLKTRMDVLWKYVTFAMMYLYWIPCRIFSTLKLLEMLYVTDY